MNAPEKLTCRRTCQVRRYHQNFEEAGMSKDISGSELLAQSLCSGLGDEGLSSGETKLDSIFITVEITFTKPSINRKEPEQAKRMRFGTIIGMISGNTSKKRPHKQSEQWSSNEISFPSMLGCQLADSPIILEALIEGFLVQRIYVNGGSSSEVMYEHCFRNLGAETKAKLKESRTPLVGFSGEVSYPIRTINISVTMGEPERLRTIPMEFVIIKSHSPYNVILGRTGLRSLGVVASTIHSMIKFPTSNGIAMMTTKREILKECQRMEEARGPAMEGRITIPRIQAPESEGTTNKGREESGGQTDKVREPDGIIRPSPIPFKKGTPADEKDKGNDEPLEKSLESKPPEKVVIHEEYPDQTITIGGNSSVECRSRLIEILRKHVDAFAWTPTDMTRIPHFIAEHELKTYPHREPRV
ncbi:reverse transcriptase domain-containing protein [Tanacetum coccineum]